jgi:hypothetical protein
MREFSHDEKFSLRFNRFNKFSALLNTKGWFLECCLSVSKDGWVDGMQRQTDIGVTGFFGLFHRPVF